MTTHRGNAGIVKVAAAVVAHRVTWTVDETTDVEEDTGQGQASKTYKSGLKSWSGSMECRWDKTDTTGQEALKNGVEIELNFYPEGDGSGAVEMKGTGIITGVSVVAPHDDIVARNFTFTGTGDLIFGAVA